MRIFRSDNNNEIKMVMRDIGVDPYGIKLMLPKTAKFLIRLNQISNIAANILKQEMLSLGGDVAVSKGALNGKIKKGPCLIISQANQLNSLINKLRLQPFGLNRLADELEENISKYNRESFILPLRKSSLNLSDKTRIMGIINLTPDSFSGDGLYSIKAGDFRALALKKAKQMLKDGADIIDLGGESSRPGSRGISAREELRRVLPIVKSLAKNINAPISIDTSKAEVAKACLENGAQIINDISGLRDKKMVETAAKYKAAVVIMHMHGRPLNMQKKVIYKSLIEDISSWLSKAVDTAEQAGVVPDKIIIDPGIGFGKKTGQNLEIIKRLSDFKILGKPILIGPSRKTFIGNLLNKGPLERCIGTLAVCVLAAQRGANIVRVHDVKEVSQALKIADAIRSNANA